MIKHCILIFLLLMLLSIGQLFGISLDNERCMTDTVCFVPDRCIRPSGSDELILLNRKYNVTGCNAWFQIKPYTAKKFLVKMQVTSDNSDLDTKRGLSLSIDDDIVSFCNETISYMSSIDPKNIISMPSGTNIVTNSSIQCAQFISGPSEDISLRISYATKQFALNFSYINNTEQKIESTENTKTTLDTCNGRIGCDPDNVKSSIIHQPSDVNLTTFDDTTRPSFDCSHLAGHSTYIQHHGQLKQATDLKCEENQFSYKDSRNVSTPIPALDTFSVYCGIPVCSMCTDIPEYKCTNTNACSTPEFINSTTPGSCVSLTCPDNRWIYNNGTTITKAPECKRSNSTKGGYAWTMNQNGHDIEMKKGACSQQYDCATATPIKSVCAPNGKMCASLQISNNIECTIPSTQMIVEISSSERKSPKKISCDDNTGLWYADGEKSSIIPKGSNVYCEPDSYGHHAVEAGTLIPSP